MKISRRNFLGSVTGATATLFSFQSIRSVQHSAAPGRNLDCALLDLNSHCVLRESLQGYQLALAGEYNHLLDAWPDSRCHCRMVIVPSLGRMDPAVAQAMSDFVNDGSWLLLESGAAFLTPREFATHQKGLDRHFNLAVEPPVDLWSGKPEVESRSSGRHRGKTLDTRGHVPYVSYVWPQETMVRDFSRVIPVSPQPGDVIGMMGEMPVALKKRVGRGTLIFLGSPIGPALGARDPEAKSWLRSVTAL